MPRVTNANARFFFGLQPLRRVLLRFNLICNHTNTGAAHGILMGRAVCTSMLFTAMWCIFAGAAASAAPPGDSNPSDQATMDVIALVWPVTQDSARVAIAYKHKVPQQIVNRDTSRLAAVMHGVIGDLQINDESAHPDRLKEFPVNTAAQFTISGCNQIKQSSPDLHPYLVAFQAWTHLEVVFAVPTIHGYSGVVNFESPALAVALIKEPDEYRYDVEIREHKKDLPSLPQNQLPADAPTSASTSALPESVSPAAQSKPSGISIAVLGTGMCAAIVIVFLGFYVFRLQRHSIQAERTGRTNL